MAPGPLSGPAPEPDEALNEAPGLDQAVAARFAALRAERDELEARALEAEAIAEDLADSLAAARVQLAQQAQSASLANADNATNDGAHLTLFDESTSGPTGPRTAPDGSDPGVTAIALGAVALVAVLVAVLSMANSGITFFTLLMVIAAAGLAWAGWRARVVPVHVSVTDGVVYVESSRTTHRFNVRSNTTRIHLRGRPGDADWRVRFTHGVLDPCDVDATMVVPEEFLAQLRAYRPDL